MTDDLILGADGLSRCAWAASTADYRDYHDDEWGRPVRGDIAIFERLSLEAFQSGLSWLTILRKREAFRDAFAGFDPRTVAAYEPIDVDRLLADAGIVRNRSKIEATIANAQTLVTWQEREGDGVLDDLVWAHHLETAPPKTLADVPAQTAASANLARALRSRGWRFIGPTTAYAALQAMGVVNDHLEGCSARAWVQEGLAAPRRG